MRSHLPAVIYAAVVVVGAAVMLDLLGIIDTRSRPVALSVGALAAVTSGYVMERRRHRKAMQEPVEDRA